MNLSSDQREAIARGEAVPIVVETTDCVVVRADVYQRVKAVLGDELTAEEVGRLIERNMRDEDAGDPLLDSYQRSP